jgi:hypothetical protein
MLVLLGGEIVGTADHLDGAADGRYPVPSREPFELTSRIS